MRLKDKVAVITGAATGIGRASALLFAREDARVVIGDVNDAEAEETLRQARDGGGEIQYVRCDVSRTADVDALVRAAAERYGRLDVMFNNAGRNFFGKVHETSDEDWEACLSLNLGGIFRGMRAAIRHMLAQGGGSIINIASTAAIHGGAAGAAYTAAKHALVGLTRNTAWMYAKRGIRCNAICPGATMTNIGETMTRDRVDAIGAARTMEFSALAPAYLQPSDIASLALFLASDESRYINGAIIPADAGWAAV